MRKVAAAQAFDGLKQNQAARRTLLAPCPLLRRPFPILAVLLLTVAPPLFALSSEAPARFRLVGDSRAGSGVADANGDAFGKVAVDPAWQCIIDDLRVILPGVPAVRSTHAARSRGASPPPSRNPGLGARLSAHWSAYRRAFGPGFTWPAAVCRLPGYLMAKWELPSPRRLPIRVRHGPTGCSLVTPSSVWPSATWCGRPTGRLCSA